ncbi:hypothetical protein [Terracidiphilus gabretensis]|uniref:hypothetical protein n=1 Tax=Terracidiphilus gabretensis TaxID=1577687 RepID=UPI0018D1F6F9|nr:hypothetical protein [Terracidiphilus gabretensis]
MKPSLIIKFLFLITSGLLVGYRTHLDLIKWNHLGREAFLANQQNRFDKYMAHPQSVIALVVFSIFAMLVWAALYEGLAFAGKKLFSRAPKKESFPQQSIPS